jgi:hypothetical protein
MKHDKEQGEEEDDATGKFSHVDTPYGDWHSAASDPVMGGVVRQQSEPQ